MNSPEQVESATPDLFRGARVVLAPEASTQPEALALVRGCWEAIGSRVAVMDVSRVMAMVENPAVAEIAREVDAKMRRVLARLSA